MVQTIFSKRHSEINWPLEHFFLRVGHNNFWKKISFQHFQTYFSVAGEIAALVEEKRAADQSDGSNSIAGTLEGFVRRKVIKQTVMTTVYGVTGYGAKLQIAKQLKDIDEFPQDKVNEGTTVIR